MTAAAAAAAAVEEVEEEEDEEEERSIGSSGSIEAPEVSNCLTGGRTLFFLSHTPVCGAAICIVRPAVWCAPFTRSLPV